MLRIIFGCLVLVLISSLTTYILIKKYYKSNQVNMLDIYKNKNFKNKEIDYYKGIFGIRPVYLLAREKYISYYGSSSYYKYCIVFKNFPRTKKIVKEDKLILPNEML